MSTEGIGAQTFEWHEDIHETANTVAILDTGAQYGGLVDRNVRELGVRTVMLPLDAAAEVLQDYGAIVMPGGPKSVYEADAPHSDPAIYRLGVPVLGICYGKQEMVHQLGGRVGRTQLREDGPQATNFLKGSLLLEGLEGSRQVLMSHGDSVVELPPGFRVIGQSESLVSAIEDPDRKLYGVQFHPEVFQTESGKEIFRNFLFKIAGLEADYTINDQIHEAKEHVRTVAQGRPLLVLLSGGVDSSATGALLEGFPNQHLVHFDNGFMREGESAAVVASFAVRGTEVKLLDRAERFYNATAFRDDGIETPPLCEVTSPKEKRRIIGDTFTNLCKEYMQENGIEDSCVIVQGTLRPDLIESGSSLASKEADVIKEHHNDTPLIRALRAEGRVADPMQRLYKDQVRAIGRLLGLPAEFVERHPFPGPGLAIRILCSKEPYRIDEHEFVQASLDSLVRQNGLAKKFRAHLLPVQTVGVQGDARSYKYLAGIEGELDWAALQQLSSLITNNVHDVNRACYIFGDIDRNSLDGITPTLLTPDVIAQERASDAIATEVLIQDDLMPSLSQMPVVSFPVHFGEYGKRSIALRPFITPDFMTGIAARPNLHIPEGSVLEMAYRIQAEVPNIARMAIDLTHKPPGTTEWE